MGATKFNPFGNNNTSPNNLSRSGYFILAVKRAFDYKGRSRRREFWSFMLYYMFHCCPIKIVRKKSN